MSTKKQLNIQGMHCGGCESIIEEALADIDGVIDVKADYASAQCSINDENSIRIDFKSLSKKMTSLQMADSNNRSCSYFYVAPITHYACVLRAITLFCFSLQSFFIRNITLQHK